MVRVRFAPSPTGYLHLGSARTAIFNWLFAKHNNGKFLLRIEDTDKQRSTKENIDAIYASLKWLNLDYDEEPVLQSKNYLSHQTCSQNLLDKGYAYKEDGAIRFKIPQDQEISIFDMVHGKMSIKSDTLEDFVILRTDASPTYQISVVSDDHDMKITHILRGLDHLTNTFKQVLLYKALGWEIPNFCHIPLIHGSDGAKLSKRHGALGIESYANLGILPNAMFNYLLRLGWSHGDDEIISKDQSISWFSVKSIGKSPAKFNMDKLLSLNAHYIKEAPDNELIELLRSYYKIDDEAEKRLKKGLVSIKIRSKTILELKDNVKFYIKTITEYDKGFEIDKNLLKSYIDFIAKIENFEEKNLLDKTKEFAKSKNIKLGEIAQNIRLSLTGKNISPSVFEIMEILEKKETINRLKIFS